MWWRWKRARFLLAVLFADPPVEVVGGDEGEGGFGGFGAELGGGDAVAAAA